MADNVIILGAGFSHDAGVPLLSGFVDAMVDAAVRKKFRGVDLTGEQVNTLNEALAVRSELDGYHGRAAFDDRNIEDLLSILAFNLLGGGKKEKKSLDAMTRAIAATIELSCTIKHPGIPKQGDNYRIISDGPESYRWFWQYLFSWVARGNQMPAIITFNYDLILERSLFQLLINTVYDGYKVRVPFRGFRIAYHHEHVADQIFKIEHARYGDFDKQRGGTILRFATPADIPHLLPIHLLKLHGSVNFPKDRKAVTDGSITDSLDHPHILPPISNKLAGNTAEGMWRAALTELREAKNVVFVGYSLPRTDIYMQYFLKAALGPNRSLSRILVFDPVLYGPAAADMRSRYEACFSEQLRQRITFRPDEDLPVQAKSIRAGTFEHFIHALSGNPEQIFF